MTNDGLGDWRIRAITTLAKDLPQAYPGGPSHKAGVPVYLQTLTKDSYGKPVGFTTPSPTALSLNIAIKASKKAIKLREKFVFESVTTPFGTGKSIKTENLSLLYNYFEYCMITSTFSFQALETFCNSVIADNIKGKYELYRKNKKIKVSVKELQKTVSTEEKLAVILPDIFKTKSPKHQKIWKNFKGLKRIRDSTIHLKAHDAYCGAKIDKESLFYHFFSSDINELPILAIEMIEFFLSSKDKPRWLQLARNQVSY